MGQRRADNPVIGYLLVDRAYRVLDPRGGQQDPAFGTPAAARAAAARLGCGDKVAGVEALHLAGLLSVLQDGGDIQLDGLAAQRLVAACQAQGLAVADRLSIDPTVADALYSSRRLLRMPRPRRPAGAGLD
jgi:hypothetical protein